jgi:hypothetical protein
MPPQLPPRLLPVLYFGVAHVALALAFAAVVADPRGVSGFFYHARMLAVVHLVTLGWITASILGSLDIVGPIALRAECPAMRIDYVAFALVVIGIVGMVAHFWLAEYGGMAWSAATVGAGIMAAGASIVRRLRGAAIPLAVSAHIVLAFVNVLGAATIGTLIGFDKVYHFLPGFVMANVFAHAHLAAIGWASMMVVGVAYRLLPMILPAEMPGGARLWASAVLLQAGVTALFVALLLRSAYVWLPALMIVAGFAAFLSQVVWMLRRRRRRPGSESRWPMASSGSWDPWRKWSSGWEGGYSRCSRGTGPTRTAATKARHRRHTRCRGVRGRRLCSSCGSSAFRRSPAASRSTRCASSPPGGGAYSWQPSSIQPAQPRSCVTSFAHPPHGRRAVASRN